ncbi:hypothetical protein D9758_002272 [Tetrapyrgos nigripes]|uniref:Homeobox domain-containing protein n=1 Tax=Tetrapyrgos nigripes TaxID=182062 RepID=A0A8H5GP60_9AGAR|nr:hypothetical protein D9758_002272 [Tetrapyrgos nigripes]
MTLVHPPDDLDSRLLSTLDQFFDSHLSSTLPAFASQWDGFCTDLQSPHSEVLLNEDTGRIADCVASEMEVLCQTFLDLEVFADGVMKRFIQKASATSTGKDIQECPKPQRYMRSAHEWLLANLHEPYPSLETREELGEAAGFSRKSVDNWFIDARKYIGWNALRQKFKTRKELISEAFRYFQPQKGRFRKPSVYDEAFENMRHRAMAMFDDDASQSSSRSVSEARSFSDDESPKPAQSLVYAEEEPSIPAKQQSRVTFIPFIPTTSLKRQAQDDDVPAQTQSKKRRRSDDDEEVKSTPSTTPSSTPSPPAASSPSYPTSAPPANRRKRRLSESDGGSAPKRPRHQAIVAPGRSVSEPLLPSITFRTVSELENWLPTFKPEPTPELEFDSAELALPDLDDSWSNSSSSGPSTPDRGNSPLPKHDGDDSEDSDDSECYYDLGISTNITLDHSTWAKARMAQVHSAKKTVTSPSVPRIVDPSANQHDYWQPPSPEGDATPAGDKETSELFSKFRQTLSNVKRVKPTKPSINNLVWASPVTPEKQTQK